jgi:hypothetical protein
MKFELYEVWAEDSDLIDTTSSLIEAKVIAQQTLDDGAEFVIIYREADDGELEVVEEM